MPVTVEMSRWLERPLRTSNVKRPLAALRHSSVSPGLNWKRLGVRWPLGTSSTKISSASSEGEEAIEYSRAKMIFCGRRHGFCSGGYTDSHLKLLATKNAGRSRAPGSSQIPKSGMISILADTGWRQGGRQQDQQECAIRVTPGRDYRCPVAPRHSRVEPLRDPPLK